MDTKQVAELKANPLNPRGPVTVDDELRELAASITAVGLLQPLVVTPSNIVIAGHRRLEAARLAGLSDVPVFVRDVSETEQLQLMLIENVQRQSLDCAQEGLGYLRLRERGLSLNEVCKRVGVSIEAVKPRLAIASMCPEARAFYAQSKVPINSAEVVASTPPEEQVEWLKKAVEEEWPGNKLQREIRQSQKKPEDYEEPTEEDKRQWAIANAICKLYKVTDELEQYSDLRPALFKIGDGIRGLEEAVATRRRKQMRSA